MNVHKRMHPFKIIQAGIRLIVSNVVLIIILFVLNSDDAPGFLLKARIAFIVYLAARFILIVIQWWKTTYIFTNDAVHQYRGIFKKKHHYMDLDQIENIQQNTPYYFKVFGVTSLILNTRSTDSSTSITFEALSNKEAKRINDLVEAFRNEDIHTEDEVFENDTQINNESVHPNIQHKLHFTSDRKSLFKGALLSLNILVIVPVLLTIYQNMKDVLPLEKYTDVALDIVTHSWITIALTVVVLIMGSILIGFIGTFLTYGKYEITSDKKRIYIQSGVLNKKHMSIPKTNVQAIRIHQSPLKKWLNMSEIMFVSTATDEEDGLGIQSLYPFLSTNRANDLVQELLPHFDMVKETKKLPKLALLMKMIRIPWFFIMACLFVWMFQSSWAFILPIIFIWTYVSRYLDYRNSRYAFSDTSIQFYSGGLSSVSFHANRSQVIEVEVNQSFIQQKLGLATIQIMNKSIPVHEESLVDIQVEDADQFLKWYSGRIGEVVFQK